MADGDRCFYGAVYPRHLVIVTKKVKIEWSETNPIKIVPGETGPRELVHVNWILYLVNEIHYYVRPSVGRCCD